MCEVHTSFLTEYKVLYEVPNRTSQKEIQGLVQGPVKINIGIPEYVSSADKFDACMVVGLQHVRHT